MKDLIVKGAIVLGLGLGCFAVPAAAQSTTKNSTVTGAAGGAAAGAVIGGPVGAAVGGVAGAVAGAALDPPPPKVIQYVEAQPLPAEPVVVQQEIVVGKPLPETVVVTPIPDDTRYAYAVVNEKRVIVEPKSRTVVQVVQ
ncbi:DUF1236 domain-containing protein (plasmid) [Sinorhizobium meliloti]|uniref:DUF1236 domain-containing protein n=1 Tax=Rhizobium meliloti TaxID=382 RepID=UPI002D794E31|nr:DUF1236 domain-containing protein [Sinorhizobium meliloti]WRQ70196.1 DUF1236 domain-containing protein [Sinorhizobium meliloti]